MYKMQFQGRSVLKFSCTSGANNQPHQFSRMDARCIIATSETILNIVKKFCSEIIPSYSEIFHLHPPIHQRFATALTGASASQQPLLPAGVSMPKALTIEGNLTANWKKFKRTWDNYAVVARLNRFEDEFKTATFLSCIGEDALEMLEGLDFPSEDDRKKLEVVITSLRDSLIRDRLVLGIDNNNIQKKLLQDRKLTLTKAIDICRSSEKTKQQVKEISADNAANEAEINAFVNNKTEAGSRERGVSEWIGEMGDLTKSDADIAVQPTSEKKELCPAFGSRCNKCGRENHFAKVCMQKEKIQRKKSVRAVSGNESTESGDSIQTVELVPSKNHTIMTVQDPDTYQPCLFTTMKIKGGETSKFQIDTGATCNVIRKKELKGTKYEKRIKPAAHVLKMYKSSLSPVGKCKIQVQDVTTKKKFKVPFTVVDDHHVKNNLLGSRAVQQMKLIRVVTTNHIHQVNNDHMGLTMAEIEETYHDLFEGQGNLGPKLHREVDPEVPPVQMPLGRSLNP